MAAGDSRVTHLEESSRHALFGIRTSLRALPGRHNESARVGPGREKDGSCATRRDNGLRAFQDSNDGPGQEGD